MNTQKLIMNPKVIRISKNTLILICGPQDSGKSTLCQQHFAQENVVCSDDLFIEVYNSCKLLLNPNVDPFNMVAKATDEKLQSQITTLASTQDYVVLDSVSPETERRDALTSLFRNHFENIIQIVIMPKWHVIANRKSKTLIPEKKALHLRVPTKQEVKKIYDSIQTLINTKEISIGPDTTYILTYPEKVNFQFE